MFIRVFCFLFFNKPQYTGFGCAVFVFSFKYLYVYVQLHWINKFLHFHNIVYYAFFFPPTNHSTSDLVVLFLSFLLNIYMCIYSYTELTNSYNIFTIIDNLHCSLALFFFHNTLVLLVLLNIICAYTITLMQQIFTIFSQSRDLSSL